MAAMQHSMANVFGRPGPGEYTDGQAHYVALATTESDPVTLLEAQPGHYRALLARTNDVDASIRPAPGEWSVKEVLGHVNDAERIFAYRLVALVRGEKQTLPSFDQDAYVEQGRFNHRSLASLLDEFDLQRQSNLLVIRPLTEEQLTIRGSINTYQQTVRALIYVMAGHAQHHIISLETDYGLG